LRNLARFAGCHIYSDHDDVVYANQGFLALHTLAAGERRVALPRTAAAFDVFTGLQVAARATSFSAKLGAEETMIYELRNPA